MDKDAPMYTLSSTTQPFYYFRVNPTSASAIVTLSRHDPAKICKGPPSSGSTTRSGSTRSSILSIPLSPKFADKHWQEVLSTSLEASSRRHRPNDGLVAHLAPTQAVKIMADKPEDEGAAYLAELECARLVWDDDSSSHFLVHPALATPFCVTVERCAAWSRVEYTLEHHESPNHLARLTRDGTGVGYLEVDTALASKIESYFLIDVAVAALLTVAASDARAAAAETFEPPPTLPIWSTSRPPLRPLQPRYQRHFEEADEEGADPRVRDLRRREPGRLWLQNEKGQEVEGQETQARRVEV
ncbi:unnamed protein product [Parascedosporium putredinis]|uniref:Uncharacterized protein n=1 Tax=Parascedosporium putredinis TaxID=1442378 RepID=A0A9P1MFC2_9PEZI|nr:unnamed protein product [Parascedosporium putredinis]CAI8002132.1 unnamed protein product [Parascedosporium putredinis]